MESRDPSHPRHRRGAAPSPGRLLRAPRDTVDRLFGYDVFIAHRRVDGAAYASRLVERIERAKLSSFIDQREYGPGDDLPAATIRNIRRATMLVVVGSPGILEARDPDWVLNEIDAYLTSRRPEERHLLPIDFGGTLDAANARSPIVARLANTIRIEEPIEALGAPPSERVVEAITRQFRKRRRDSVRLRVFQGIAAALALLALLAGTSGWMATRALREARRNLAANYLTAARSRLDDGLYDAAAALAAEALRNHDSDEARRLIVEHPPLDLGSAIRVEVEGIFAFDIHPARRLLAMVGYEGIVALHSLEPRQAPRTARLGRTDLWGVSFTPDGSRLLIGDDSGHIHVREVDDLADAPCVGVPRLDGRVDRFSFVPNTQSLLVRADQAIYSLTFDGHCPSSAPRLLYRSSEYISDYVVDRSNDRLIVTREDGLVVVQLSGAPSGPPRFHRMPLPAGATERPQPQRIALQPGTNTLAVYPLGGEQIFFLDSELDITEPLGARPFGSRPPQRVQAFGFDLTGDRLIIAADEGQGLAFVWSMSARRLERVLGVHESGEHLALLRSDSLVTMGQDTSGTGGPREMVRIVRIDPPARRPIDLPGRGPDLEPVVRSVESGPREGVVSMGSDGGDVLSLGFRSGTIMRRAREDYPIEWVGASPRGGRVAYFGGGRVTILRSGTKERQELLLDRSPTGLHSAAWLNDGTALVVGGGWTKPLLIPADPALAIVSGPQLLSGTVDDIVPGPNGQVILREGVNTWVWDTRRNRMQSVDLIRREGLAISGISAWGPGGVAALTRGGTFLWRWDELGNRKPSMELPIAGDELTVSASGNRLALFQRSMVSIHDLPAGRLRATLDFAGNDVYQAALAADGSWLIAVARGGPLVLWSLRPLDQPARELADSVQRLTGQVKPDFSLALPAPATRMPEDSAR